MGFAPSHIITCIQSTLEPDRSMLALLKTWLLVMRMLAASCVHGD